jgi:hypothetical protein
MKTSIIALAIALASGSAFATNYGPSQASIGFGAAEASSNVAVGSLSATANIGNGFAKQGTEVGAFNQSGASVKLGNGTVETGAVSEGATYSKSYGIAHHALGVTGGFAGQTGSAGAEGVSLVVYPAPRSNHDR